ncbi:hypothetical protein BSZ32_00580 [Rubritalea profundi]|uniref:DUF2062 domain-containing protein n=2 Tax=Rubritalea profundi TaxID=1658618 RepID=A0A2S7TXU5_9BACT|nr:hypothetical protein BSZ32_00580 [Rubritalea profundi]
MKRKYLRMVRRTYRYLRHPRIRKIKWLSPFTKAIFNKRYWKPCRATVANGLSIGLFCAMLPIPMQMLVAALGCLRGRGNVPVALAACWVTNPVTQIPIWVLQEKFGWWLHESVGVPNIPFLSKLEFSKDIPTFEIFGNTIIDASTVSGNAGNFILGFLAAGITLSLLAYPLVWGISMFLPNRGKALDVWDSSI